MNAHSFIKITILQHTGSYLFQASLAHLFCTVVLSDDGPVRSETCRILCACHIVIFIELYAFIGSYCNNIHKM